MIKVMLAKVGSSDRVYRAELTENGIQVPFYRWDCLDKVFA